MKIAIISDIHDNLPNLDKALCEINKEQIETILCPGDLANSEALEHLAAGFTGDIYLVQGNACSYTAADCALYKNIHNLGRRGGVINLAGQKIGLCHEPKLATTLLEQNPDIIFYGHTHKPYEDKAPNGTRLVNPGNVSNFDFPPTFAIYDTATEDIRLILIDELP
ncbi:MAG: metallophosphoesterase family protein [Candidatus Falkowbacteria bacterium]